ncbi:hypothetical protein EMCRGX_G031401 [Ephydatia muelleri]
MAADMDAWGEQSPEMDDLDAQFNALTPEEDICRVCRTAATAGRPLFYPCLCTGSIKYIHQDCLVQWLRHSGKEYCELCNHRFQFAPIYRPDMPARLPVSDLVYGISQGTLTNLRHWMHLSFVAFMWLVIVPICIYRIYRFLLYGSMWSVVTFPLELLSLDNLFMDGIYGLVVVFVSLVGFISLVWLKDQLGNGGGPPWLENDPQQGEIERQILEEVQDRGGEGGVEEEQGEQEEGNAPLDVTEAMRLEMEIQECTEHLNRLVEDRFKQQMDTVKRSILDHFERPVAQSAAAAGISAADFNAVQPSNSVSVKMLADLRDEELHLEYEQRIHREMALRLIQYRGNTESPEMEDMLPEEQELILRIRRLQTDWQIARQREEEAAEQQRRQQQEANDRWFHRFIGRPQEEPGQRAANPPRPNIGVALAGLAREPAEDQGVGGDNMDELTWSRLLGLDGSFRFLEHVVWLILLNSALIVAFAAAISLWEFLGIVTWQGVVCIFVGYVVASLLIMVFYYGAGLARVPRVKNLLGFIYVAIKVGLILTVEAGIFPLMSGWWIDVCAMGLFGSTLKSRQTSLQSAPGTVMFLHWLAGMIFIFYFASFVILLREVLRPGVLWFLRNLNDQNFHPIQEMIGLPFQRHFRRFLMSCVMFGTSVIVIVLIPTKIVGYLPGFLPYNLTLTSAVSVIREVQLELILLQFVIPTLLEHGNTRAGFKIFVQFWAHFTANVFGLHSYLLDRPQSGGTVVDINEAVIRHIPYDPQFPGPVYDGPLQVTGPGYAPFKPYLRPRLFYLRILGFVAFSTCTAIVFCTVVLTLPVFAGRHLLVLAGVEGAPDIYTAAIGFYIISLACRAGSSLLGYLVKGFKPFAQQLGVWTVQALKCLTAGVLLFVIIPLLLGHLVDLFVITPLRVPTDRTPVFYQSTEWALGMLHMKCTCGVIWLTNISFKRTLDQLYQGGIRNLNLTFVLKEVAWPVIVFLSLCILVPYIILMGVLPQIGFAYTTCLVSYRYFYPVLMLAAFSLCAIVFCIQQCRKLYNHIKNEKYLVGQQLVNYGNEMVGDAQLSTPIQESRER